MRYRVTPGLNRRLSGANTASPGARGRHRLGRASAASRLGSHRVMVNGTKKAPALSSPYTARYVRSLFERLDLPRNLTWSSLTDGFHSAPTSNVFLVSVAGGHVRTIALRSSRLDCTEVQGRPSSHWRCGFDAWQRYKRFEYYVYQYPRARTPD